MRLIFIQEDILWCKNESERDSSCPDWFIAVKYAIIVIKDEENIVIVDEKRK